MVTKNICFTLARQVFCISMKLGSVKIFVFWNTEHDTSFTGLAFADQRFEPVRAGVVIQSTKRDSIKGGGERHAVQ